MPNRFDRALLAVNRWALIAILAAKQERNVEDRDIRHEVRQRAGGGECQVERAELHAFDRLAFGAERGGIKGLNFVPAVGAPLDFARERVDSPRRSASSGQGRC
jgi:hypothetical protein